MAVIQAALRAGAAVAGPTTTHPPPVQPRPGEIPLAMTLVLDPATVIPLNAPIRCIESSAA